MLHQPDFSQTKPRSYEQIGHRVQQIIANPHAQKTQAVTVARLPNEDPDDWRQLLYDLAETAGIRVEQIEGETVRIGWREYCDC